MLCAETQRTACTQQTWFPTRTDGRGEIIWRNVRVFFLVNVYFVLPLSSLSSPHLRVADRLLQDLSSLGLVAAKSLPHDWRDTESRIEHSINPFVLLLGKGKTKMRRRICYTAWRKRKEGRRPKISNFEKSEAGGPPG